MSFLNLRRLLPPKKVWKMLANKLQIIKSHKLNRSRAIEKPKVQPYKTFKKLSWPFLSIQHKKFKLKPRPHTLIHLNKLTPPVYVNRLFVNSVKQPPPGALRKELANNNKSSYFKKRRGYHQKNETDDMWEFRVSASPQAHTQGINEKADEFIARFRAQMHHQEMQARRL